MLPRYSVSSSPLAEGGYGKLTVAFSVFDYLTPEIEGAAGGRMRVGGVATRYLEALCSPYLASSSSSPFPPTVRIFPKPTQVLRLPSPPSSSPLVLAGTGMGVEPFLGFLSHLRALGTKAEETHEESARADPRRRQGHVEGWVRPRRGRGEGGGRRRGGIGPRPGLLPREGEQEGARGRAG